MDVHPLDAPPNQVPSGLQGLSLRGFRTKPDGWFVSVAELQAALASDRVKAMPKLTYDANEKATYFVRTADNTSGIVQLLAQTDEPKGIRLQYKTFVASKENVEIKVGMTFDEVIAAKGRHYRLSLGMRIENLILVYDDIAISVDAPPSAKGGGKVIGFEPGLAKEVVQNVPYADAETAPPVGLEFLKLYPKLHGLSLDMTEPQFLEIVKQQELKTRKTVEGEKVTHHIGLGDCHTLIVMFYKDAKCGGIQRVRGEDDALTRPEEKPGKDKTRTVAEDQMEFPIQVVTNDGRPVVGAKVQLWAYGTSRGSALVENKWSPETTTDAAGQARVVILKELFKIMAFVEKPGKNGIPRIWSLNLRVEHPQYSTWSQSVEVANPIRVVLAEPATIEVCAHRENDAELLREVMPVFSSYGGSSSEWLAMKEQSQKEGVLMIRRVDLTSKQAARWLRLVHVPKEGPALFSELIDLKPLQPPISLNVAMQPGVRVAGRLPDTVPRPVVNGRVAAQVVSGGSDASRNWFWSMGTTITKDGSFVLDSVPANENLQLIAVCDGWVSRSPTEDEMTDYAKQHGFETKYRGRSAGDGVVYPQLFRTIAPVIEPLMPMERTTDCEVTVVDEKGQPIPDVVVAFAPNQHWFHGGSTVANLPVANTVPASPAMHVLLVFHANYEAPIQPRSDGRRMTLVELHPSQTGRVTIRMTAVKPTGAEESAQARPKQESSLDFLKPYPKLHGLSLDMTEPQFLEIVKRQELKTRKTVENKTGEDEKVTHHIGLGDGHTLIVMFDMDGKCSGIQRVHGDGAEARGERGAADSLPKREELMARRVSLRAKEIPLKAELAELARQARVELQLDVEALKKVELDVDEPVSAAFTDEPLGEAIGRLIDWQDYCGAFMDFRGERVMLTTIDAMQERIARELPDWLQPLYTQGLLATLVGDRQIVSISSSRVMTDELMAKLKTLSKLKELEIGATKTITPAGLKHLGQLRQLETLSLTSVNDEGHGLGDAAMQSIAGLKSLRERRVSECGLTDAGARLLEGLSQLTRLELSEARLTDASLASIGQLKNRKHLGLSGLSNTVQYGRMHFTAKGLRSLAALRDLEELHLVGQEVTAELLSFPKLTALSIGLSSGDNACAERIAACRDLKPLSLVYSQVTDAGLKQIATLPSLRQLNIDSHVITDAGIEHLKALKALELLTLRVSRLTDETLRHVSEMKSLTRLMCNLSEDELNTLEEALPHTAIHHMTGGGSLARLPKSLRKVKGPGRSVCFGIQSSGPGFAIRAR